jgi:AGCS family alanine or glycine:cation symporter
VFPHGAEHSPGRYSDPDAPGEVSQFQALTTALAGTVGLGNIAGVAIAIGIGGPGAAFWMIVIAFFAMSLKFAESMLAVKHRTILADGTVYGGPMYYLRAALEQKTGHARQGARGGLRRLRNPANAAVHTGQPGLQPAAGP